MTTRKIRRRRRGGTARFAITEPLDLAYRDVVADLDPGMLRRDGRFVSDRPGVNRGGRR